MSKAMREREGAWIQVYSGRALWPFDPRPEEIDIEDVAHALSQQCRYSGHTREFYSVAEHCFFVSLHCSFENALAALLHDASEAYLADIPGPLKPLMRDYRRIESKLMECIAQKYGFAWPLPKEIETLDRRIRLNERRRFLSDPPHPWNEEGLEPLPGLELCGWPPHEAKTYFLRLFEELTKQGGNECPKTE